MTSRIPFDPSALTEPVDRAQVRAFTQSLRNDGRLGSNAAGIIVGVIIGVVFLFLVFPLLGTLFFAFASAGVDGFRPVSLIVPIGIAVVAAFGIVALVRGLRGAGERRYRLDRFARANGMQWLPRLKAPALPGMIFGQGSSRAASDLIRGQRPRFVEIGNYTYTTGSGKNRSTHRWGYVAIRLDVPLPHIVLDATGNNGLFGSNLPTVYGRDQRLSLEGDFDQHFALYCPSGYERDALYLFTPDVMARFIDNAATLDVEIVDDWLFLYSKRNLSTLDPATWAWLFTTIAAILDKLAQWARWRDERLETAPAAGGMASGIPGATSGAAPILTPPPAGVAREGRRLRRGFSWVAVAVFGIVAIYWVLSITVDLLGR